MREFNYPENIYNEPSVKDVSEVIGRLIGYCVSIGWTNKEMPSEHLKEVCNYTVDLLMTFPTKTNQERGE